MPLDGASWPGRAAEARELLHRAHEVAHGVLTYGEALDALMLADLRRGGEADLATEERLGAELADLAQAVQEGWRGRVLAGRSSARVRTHG